MVRETLAQIWDGAEATPKRTRVAQFEHIAMLLGYSAAEVEAFLDEPSPTQNDADDLT
jgi:hypothetical protein